jgi:hypothetical protein
MPTGTYVNNVGHVDFSWPFPLPRRQSQDPGRQEVRPEL